MKDRRHENTRTHTTTPQAAMLGKVNVTTSWTQEDDQRDFDLRVSRDIETDLQQRNNTSITARCRTRVSPGRSAAWLWSPESSWRTQGNRTEQLCNRTLFNMETSYMCGQAVTEAPCSPSSIWLPVIQPMWLRCAVEEGRVELWRDTQNPGDGPARLRCNGVARPEEGFTRVYRPLGLSSKALPLALTKKHCTLVPPLLSTVTLPESASPGEKRRSELPPLAVRRIGVVEVEVPDDHVCRPAHRDQAQDATDDEDHAHSDGYLALGRFIFDAFSSHDSEQDSHQDDEDGDHDVGPGGLQMQCKVYDSLLALPSDLQAARAMVVIAILFSLFGLLLSVVGGKCTTCVGDKVTKGRVAISAGVFFMLSGALCLVTVSLPANTIIKDFYNPLVPDSQRRELGACLYVGWGASGLLLIGGALLCCQCPSGGDRYNGANRSNPAPRLTVNGRPDEFKVTHKHVFKEFIN
ncbi:Claudin-6 [Liparis tanakae]|uniref:Claudin-6 n=1 Tax=Liparis tanakae TaxID=230148 RepID=A0A4Z2G6W4_9TELE|nr:Claudin-6 [Liparis tanakae]